MATYQLAYLRHHTSFRQHFQIINVPLPHTKVDIVLRQVMLLLCQVFLLHQVSLMSYQVALMGVHVIAASL